MKALHTWTSGKIVPDLKCGYQDTYCISEYFLVSSRSTRCPAWHPRWASRLLHCAPAPLRLVLNFVRAARLLLVSPVPCLYSEEQSKLCTNSCSETQTAHLTHLGLTARKCFLQCTILTPCKVHISLCGACLAPGTRLALPTCLARLAAEQPLALAV